VDTLKTFYSRNDSPTLDGQLRTELDALINELAVLNDELLLAESDVARQNRADRIQRLADALQLGVIPTSPHIAQQ